METAQIVRAVWAGGVVRPDGHEAGEAERLLYRVTMKMADDSVKIVTPFALADLGDGDNNHLLCLDFCASIFVPRFLCLDFCASIFVPRFLCLDATGTLRRFRFRRAIWSVRRDAK
jgi:hypothetical protein